MCLEGFQRVSEECLGMMRVSGGYEEGVWKVSNFLGQKFTGTKKIPGHKFFLTLNYVDHKFFGPLKNLGPILDLISF